LARFAVVVYRTLSPALAIAVPMPMSRWDLPVPDSPIRGERLAGGDPGGLGEGVDDLGGEVGVDLVVEVLDALGAGEPGLADQPGVDQQHPWSAAR
jgi:hypothetical protein